MPSGPSSAPPPEITDHAVRWSIPRAWAPDGVRLEVDWILEQARDFVLDGDSWLYTLARPPAWRLEYRLELVGIGLGLDPTNPVAVPNPFGDRSVISFPDYLEPDWLTTPTSGEARPLDFAVEPLSEAVPARLWSPAELADDIPAPMLVVHDGSGMAESGAILAWATAYARTRPLRLCLLDSAAGRRDEWYSDDPDYADWLSDVALPRLRTEVAVGPVIGLGASLGATAMLSWHRRRPESVDALVLQSGSFFTPELDPQESGFGFFDRVVAAVRAIADAPPDRRIPLLMTCGAIEENLANNGALSTQLTALGYPLTFIVNPDAHTMIGWRDCWSPHVDRLLDRVG